MALGATHRARHLKGAQNARSVRCLASDLDGFLSSGVGAVGGGTDTRLGQRAAPAMKVDTM